MTKIDIFSGFLGAGKTTLAQGIAEGLGVRGRVTSPTFTIARVHAALGAGPDLVHVDAYRIGALEEVDALDLDASADTSATVVESVWSGERVSGRFSSGDLQCLTAEQPQRKAAARAARYIGIRFIVSVWL